jgi:sigma-E factor negative regulatory protein RseA
MNTKEITQEQISAFADGELADEHIAVVVAALRRTENRADWEMYHQIGDVLRSDDMDINLSSGFAARMSARLEMEPTIVAPVGVNVAQLSSFARDGQHTPSETASEKSGGKRWTMPGLVAAAAMAAVAYIATPQLMVAMQGNGAIPGTQAAGVTSPKGISSSAPDIVAVKAQGDMLSSSVSEGVVLRDPRIDDYLLAHQRFSPSVYSTAQYARSATFANDSTK